MLSSWSGGHVINVASSWRRNFGGNVYDEGYSVRQTADGRYIVAGCTESYGAGRADVWLIKVNAAGDNIWDKTFGGADDDAAYSVQETVDGGYIIAGYTGSYGAGEADAWLIKVNAFGDKEWDKTFGGAYDDYAVSVQQLSHGYIVAGSTNSYGAGGPDVWLIKVNASGDTVWTRTFGGARNDRANSVQQTADGGYIIAGYTDSYGAGSSDCWLIKANGSGDKEWTKTFGGSDVDAAYSVQETVDGGYIIAGYTNSYGAGSGDCWLIRVNASGDKEWAKTFGGPNNDAANSVQQTADGGYIIAGYTGSYGAGSLDYWLIKVNASGDKEWDRTFGGADYDAARSVQQTADGGYIIAGCSRSHSEGMHDVWLVKTYPDGD